MSKKMIAIAVGHNSRDKGAIDVLGRKEWEFNCEVANILASELKRSNHDACIFYHDSLILSYSGRMKKTAIAMEDWQRETGKKIDLCLELHFNSSTSISAKGFEYIHYRGSRKGSYWAKVFMETHRKIRPKAKERSILARGINENGGGFLYYTPAPAIICEPFFGSNREDASNYTPEGVARIYLEAILDG